MRIILYDNYFIDTDGQYNYVLKRKRKMKRKKSDETYIGEEIVGYFGNSLQKAIKCCVIELIFEKLSESDSVMELHKAIDFIDETIKAATRNLEELRIEERRP